MITSMGKSLIWTLLIILFGLSQLWILIGNSYLLTNFSIIYNQILLDGVLLFFSSTLVASISIDYFISETKISSKAVSGLVFVLFPCIIIIVCIWLFTMCFERSLTDIEEDFARNVEMAVVSMTIVFTFFAKVLLFHSNSQPKKRLNLL